MSATNGSVDEPESSSIRPTTIAELEAIVRESVESGCPLIPVGGGTTFASGVESPDLPGDSTNDPSAGWSNGQVRELDLTGLDRVIDYPSEDMTITVEAGIRIRELHRIVASKGQMLPIDIPQADRATLGGAIATNSSGPRRYGHGTFRDYLIGIEYINAAGERIGGGGRVVKNVAGYDLMKMQIGAWGTLGILTQVSLKLKPMSEARGLLHAEIEGRAIEEVLASVNGSALRPVAIELARDAGSPSQNYTITLAFEECLAAVDWQLEQADLLLRRLGLAPTVERGEDAVASWLAQVTDWPAIVDRPVILEFATLPSELAGSLARWEEALPGSAVRARAGNGIVAIAPEPRSADDLLARIRPHWDSLVAAGGNGRIWRCPLGWLRNGPASAIERTYNQQVRPWMKKLRAQLDPNHRFVSDQRQPLPFNVPSERP